MSNSMNTQLMLIQLRLDMMHNPLTLIKTYHMLVGVRGISDKIMDDDFDLVFEWMALYCRSSSQSYDYEALWNLRTQGCSYGEVFQFMVKSLDDVAMVSSV